MNASARRRDLRVAAFACGSLLLGGCAFLFPRPLFEEIGRGATHPVVERCLQQANIVAPAFAGPSPSPALMACIGNALAAPTAGQSPCASSAPPSRPCSGWIGWRAFDLIGEDRGMTFFEIAAEVRSPARVEVTSTWRQYWRGGGMDAVTETAFFPRSAD